MNKLLAPYTKRGLTLKNHLVMAPMTRSRAINNVPNELMAQYYAQRTGAGLIISEGTAPLPAALGYPRIPGIFSAEQVKGWKKVTAGVHSSGTKFFMQLMHTGRIGHVDNLPEGIDLVGASDLKATGQIYTDTKGLQDFSQPIALTTDGVNEVIQGHVRAAQQAIEAGFDGIELHGANGYLLEQFLNPSVNTRTDAYGGSIQGRARLIIELAQSIANAIGGQKVGIRFSPFSTLGDLPAYDTDEVYETYHYLAQELEKIQIAYIHIGLTPAVEQRTLDAIRQVFNGTIIQCNGLTPETAEAALSTGFADLVAFGRSFLANPDLVERIIANAPLNQPDYTTLYTPGSQGYTDYPRLSQLSSNNAEPLHIASH